jgi:hypothetical protein
MPTTAREVFGSQASDNGPPVSVTSHPTQPANLKSALLGKLLHLSIQSAAILAA